MKRLFSGVKMIVLDFLVRVRQLIPIQSTWRFVGVCAITGAIIMGLLGWFADRESQAKMRQERQTQTTPQTPIKSGNATTTGDESPAVTGNGNSVTYGQPPDSKEPKSKPPK